MAGDKERFPQLALAPSTSPTPLDKLSTPRTRPAAPALALPTASTFSHLVLASLASPLLPTPPTSTQLTWDANSLPSKSVRHPAPSHWSLKKQGDAASRCRRDTLGAECWSLECERC